MVKSILGIKQTYNVFMNYFTCLITLKPLKFNEIDNEIAKVLRVNRINHQAA